MTIPKIIHQIWIGARPVPDTLMKSWKDKHPDFEYIFWNESEIQRRGLQLNCLSQINEINEINGKADILRWEILYQYGGIALDADSICIEPFDELFLNQTAFAGFENENIREGLVATGTMGFCKGHPLVGDIINWINKSNADGLINQYKAWYSVGPACLTRFLETGKYKDFTVFPSYFFLPYHFTGEKYTGHSKIYAFQEWCNTNNKYETINDAILPREFTIPADDNWISIVISNYNTDVSFVRECLNSIKHQQGYYGIELVWMDDGSTDENEFLVRQELEHFASSTRFCKLKYTRSATNMGLSYQLHRGVLLCSNELIFRMDADDIMLPTRIQTQLDYMNNNKDCVLCGSNMYFFQVLNNTRIFTTKTELPEVVSLDEFKKSPIPWIMNHPTICFRKSSICNIGNYTINNNPSWVLEDYELALKILKTYGRIVNLPDILLHYREHNKQVTKTKNVNSTENEILREGLITKILFT